MEEIVCILPTCLMSHQHPACEKILESHACWWLEGRGRTQERLTARLRSTLCPERSQQRLTFPFPLVHKLSWPILIRELPMLRLVIGQGKVNQRL